MPLPEEIVTYCRSLVVIAARHIEDTENDKDRAIMELQLAHFSVQTYLLSEEVEGTIAKSIQATAISTITKIYLAYLLELDSLPLQQICASYPLAEFAARYWASYVITIDDRSGTICQLMLELLTTAAKFWICYQLYAPDRYWQGTNSQRQECHPLYYASLCGLSDCVQDLVREGADINAQGGSYGNALCAASYSGRPETARVLIERGANINAQCGSFGNALCTAVAMGHVEIFLFLLDESADINVWGRPSAMLCPQRLFWPPSHHPGPPRKRSRHHCTRWLPRQCPLYRSYKGHLSELQKGIPIASMTQSSYITRLHLSIVSGSYREICQDQ